MKLWEPKRKCPKVVTGLLKCSVKPYVTMPLNPMLFQRTSRFIWVLTHGKTKSINGRERSECHGLPTALCEAYLQEVVFGNSPSDHETWTIWCHVGIHVDFTSISHSHTHSVGPSSVVWSNKLGPVPPCPPTRVLEVWWSRVLGLTCEVALSMYTKYHI